MEFLSEGQLWRPYPQGNGTGTTVTLMEVFFSSAAVPRDGSPVCYMISHFTSNIPVLHSAFSNLYPTLSIVPEINMLKEVFISSTKAYVALGSWTTFLKAVLFLLQCRPEIGFE